MGVRPGQKVESEASMAMLGKEQVGIIQLLRATVPHGAGCTLNTPGPPFLSKVLRVVPLESCCAHPSDYPWQPWNSIYSLIH